MAKNRTTITLSEHLGTTADKLEKLGVLNTNLGIDIKLFIDPKLIKDSSVPELVHAGDLIRAYFDLLLKVNDQSDLSVRLVEKALNMIAVKEPRGLSIGYGDKRDSGTSISLSVAKNSLCSLNEMLGVGFNDITVMEMLGLFINRFGSDSISDLIAHILYEELCKYTQRVSIEQGFTTSRFEIRGNIYHLPRHPFKKHQIIFVPLDSVSDLPIATSWDEIAAAASKNARVRKDFNDLVGKSIKQFALSVKKNPLLLMTSATKMKTLVRTYTEAKIKPYNVAEDRRGYIRLQAYADEISGTIKPINKTFTTIGEVHKLIIQTIVPQFKRQIEDLGANKLLYARVGTTLQKVDDTLPVHEDAAQILFNIVADQVCQESNVMLSREPKTAPGAVDFTLGTGYDNKVVVEIKKSTNSNLLNGFSKQVTRYQESEAADSAVYVVVIVNSKNVSNPDSQLNKLKRMYAKKIKKSERVPELCLIDGLIHDSASKL